MTSPEAPKPRPMPSRGGLSYPHIELRASTLTLVRHLARAQLLWNTQQTWRRYLHPRTSARAALQDIQLYSQAAIVFAAMTVEAALNTYGLVRFGEEAFEKHFAFHGPAQRLRRLASYGAGRELESDDPMLTSLTRLISVRNRIAHTRSEESRMDDAGVFRPHTTPQRYNWSSEVPSAVQDMDTFLTHFASLDPEATPFLRFMQPTNVLTTA